MKTFKLPPKSAPTSPSEDEEKRLAASRRSRTSRARGRGFEKSTANDIRLALGAHPEDVKRTPASVGGRDIQVHHALRPRFPYSVECKNTKTISVPSWIEQAESNVSDEMPIPAVVFKLPKNSKKYVIIPFNHFLAITKNFYEANGFIPTEETDL